MSELLRAAIEMRNAIDQIEGALMNYGDLSDMPELFDDAEDSLMLAPHITVGQMRRVCAALDTCTHIINSNAFTPTELGKLK
jgi:hypothetical protein